MEMFVINAATCSRTGEPVTNCSCGGHANRSESKPTPIPIINIDYAELAGVNPMSDEGEPEVREIHVHQQVVNQDEDDWTPDYTGSGSGDLDVVNAKDRPEPMPIIGIDYNELAARKD